MGSENFHNAKTAKNDEFYTQYPDIQKEINAYLEYDPNLFKDKTILLPCDDPEWSNFTKFFAQNFENLGLKKLISTSYAKASKFKIYGQMDLFEDTDYITKDPNYQSNIDAEKGKIFTLTRKNKKVDINDLKWEYLNGDGDFRSDEIKKLRDEADYIITNPPFSLFRDFISWLFETDKKFLIIGNMNAVTYKEVFPLIKNNKIWYGVSITSGDRKFNVPNSYPLNASGCGIDENNRKYIQVKGVRWFTNLDHGRRHQPLQLMTKADNIKFNKKLKGKEYQKYDNYDAIEVPYTDAIPSDYDEVMGVPISFLDKYCPEQFEILGITSGREEFDPLAYPSKRYENAIQHNKDGSTTSGSKANTRATILVDNPQGIYYTADNCNGKLEIVYARILIRKK